MESVVGILSEQFMHDNAGVTITYDASGSGTGIEAAGKGSCDIGLASRGLKDSEKAKGLKETTVMVLQLLLMRNHLWMISSWRILQSYLTELLPIGVW